MATTEYIDFSSSLYLGFRHGSAELGPWRRLTLGRPAAVRRWPDTAELESSVARLCGTASAVLGRSTWHLFWDLVGALGPLEWSIFLDKHCYPIARWASGRHRLLGGHVTDFGHLDTHDLQRMVSQAGRNGKRPLIVSDGICCTCGQSPDLGLYAATAARAGGLLVIDDTQGVGILGRAPLAAKPWGTAGGGSLVFHGLVDAPVATVSSLAKAFGVPIAVAAGPTTLIRRLRSDGDTSVHCSQPSAADLASLRHALTLNQADGERRRALLRRRIVWFREHAHRLHLTTTQCNHPSQAIQLPGDTSAHSAVSAVRKRGVVCLPGRDHQGQPHLVLMLSVQHTEPQIVHALDTVTKVTHAGVHASLPGWRARRAARHRPPDMA